MERLTIEKCGEILVKNGDGEYRSPCFGCESINKCNPGKMTCGFYKAIEKLKEYEDLEEQGLLLKLPCKVGDTLYLIDTDEKIKDAGVEHLTIENIVIYGDGEVLFEYDAYGGIICHLENIITDKPYLDFYRVFLTQAEAEEALKGMEEGNETD